MGSPTPADPSPSQLTIGGLSLNIYGLSSLSPLPTSRSVSVLFLLHGRYGHHNQPRVKRWASAFVSAARAADRAERVKEGGELVVVSFDQRNHGERKVEMRANVGWAEKLEGGGDGVNSLGNATHAADMHAIQNGTARDVTFLIDYLAPLLFPNDERTINDWFCAGISLGGHATWLALAHESRISLGIPIIGSPSLLTLLSHRAAGLAPPLGPLPIAAPYFPKSLLALLEKEDAVHAPKDVWKDRKILVLSGREDTLVNYVDGGNDAFVERLRAEGEVGVLETWVQDGAGHEFSDEMLARATAFVCERGLGLKSGSDQSPRL